MGVNHLLKLRGWLGDVPSFLDYLEWFSIKAKFFGAQNKTMNLLGLFQTPHFTWAESNSSSGWTNNLSNFRLANWFRCHSLLIYSQNEFKRKKKPFCKIWLKIMHLVQLMCSSAPESMLVNSQLSSNVFSQLITCMFSFTVQPQQSWNNMVR